MAPFGLIGYPLSHSLSAGLFPENSYALFPLPDLEEFPSLIRDHPELRGLNVTLPYKEKILPYLTRLIEPAGEIGAVNTIRVRWKDTVPVLEGYNTDAEGFMGSADFSGHRDALILGTGGAAKAVAHALKKLGINHWYVSRQHADSKILSYHQLKHDFILRTTLIINATQLGMYHAQDTLPPIPYEFLTEQHFLYDLVYNPPVTAFLKRGAQSGCRLQNGDKMLRIQAAASYRIFTLEE